MKSNCDVATGQARPDLLASNCEMYLCTLYFFSNCKMYFFKMAKSQLQNLYSVLQSSIIILRPRFYCDKRWEYTLALHLATSLNLRAWVILLRQLPPHWALATPHIGSKVCGSLFPCQLLLSHCKSPPSCSILCSIIQVPHPGEEAGLLAPHK